MRGWAILVLFLSGCALAGEDGLLPLGGNGPDIDASTGVEEGDTGIDACADVCSGVERDHELSLGDTRDSEQARAWATCFSCRCKDQLGVLPSPAELNCSSAAGPLKRWRPTRDGAGAITGIEEIDPNGQDTSECLNPGMAAAGCDLQSRFKRMVYNGGETEFQLLCRKRTADEPGFYEYLIIGHNQKNGATCFWQAQDSGFGGENVPKLDLSVATPDEKAQYTNTFYLYSEGPSTCTGCHSNDAFLASPYLKSEWSIAQAGGDQGARARIRPDRKYGLVTADKPRPTPVAAEDLTAAGKPLAAQCGSCHRVTKGSYCGFAAASVAEERYLGELTGADQQALVTYAQALMYWMPPGGTGSHANALELQGRVTAACE